MLWYSLIAVAVAALDIALGPSIPLWVLYLAPIALAAWSRGRSAGAAMVLLSSALVVASYFYEGTRTLPAVTTSFILGSRVLVFVLVAALVAALRKKDVGRVLVPRSNPPSLPPT